MILNEYANSSIRRHILSCLKGKIENSEVSAQSSENNEDAEVSQQSRRISNSDSDEDIY
jgi:hypothetical protein